MSRLAEWEARWQEGDGGDRRRVLVEMIHETLTELGWRVVERDVERALRRQFAAWFREVAYRPGSVEKIATLVESSGLDPLADEDRLVDLAEELIFEEARRLLEVKDLVTGACIELVGLVPDALPGEVAE